MAGVRRGPEMLAPHIPRTAGTSFGAVLAAVYGEENIELDSDDDVGNPRAPINADFEAWHRETQAALAQRTGWPKVIHGHFWLGKYEAYRASAFTVLWLREPIARLVSLHFYLREKAARQPSHRASSRELSLEDYVARYAAANRRNPNRRVMSPITERLLRGYSLSDFDFVGITEHFAEDVAELGRILGWPVVDPPAHNYTATPEYRDYRPSAELLRELRTANRADIDLYEQALELRRARVTQGQAMGEAVPGGQP